MKANSQMQGGSRYYIEKEEETEAYCVYDSETGEKVEDAEFPTRREAAAKLKELLEADAKEKAEGEEGDIDGAGDGVHTKKTKKKSKRSLDDEHDMDEHDW